VLFCSSAKGKSSIVRHLEPNLCIDDDRAMLLALKPFLDSVVHVGGSSSSSASSGASSQPATSASAAAGSSGAAADIHSVPSFPTLAHFFTPNQVAPAS